MWHPERDGAIHLRMALLSLGRGQPKLSFIALLVVEPEFRDKDIDHTFQKSNDSSRELGLGLGPLRRHLPFHRASLR